MLGVDLFWNFFVMSNSRALHNSSDTFPNWIHVFNSDKLLIPPAVKVGELVRVEAQLV